MRERPRAHVRPFVGDRNENVITNVTSAESSVSSEQLPFPPLVDYSPWRRV